VILPATTVPRVSGHFVQAAESAERPGGTGANVATALSQAGGRVHMVDTWERMPPATE
jgi:sugar/nucleoside kinase (ribokinase family)